jgi:hypothetical protein
LPLCMGELGLGRQLPCAMVGSCDTIP